MSLAQKTFYRKTKRGKILKVVREHYLRVDIWCGIEKCPSCLGSADENEEPLMNNEVIGAKNEAFLERSGANSKLKSSLIKGSHFLVLDTNVVLNEIDLLETATKGLENVILLQVKYIYNT